MSLLKNTFRKIGEGMLFGIGFGLVVGFIYYYISNQMMISMWNDHALEQVVITKHEKVKRNETVLVLGSVENQGSDPVRTMTIQVDLLDTNGKFVEQCSTYLTGTLKAGEIRNFKVSCGGCKDNPIVQHESYKVYVVGL